MTQSSATKRSSEQVDSQFNTDLYDRSLSRGTNPS
jgi:hypothetical protein